MYVNTQNQQIKIAFVCCLTRNWNFGTHVIVHKRRQNHEQKRKNYTPEEKVRLLKEHLVNGVAVSQICEENQLQPTVFYRWQRQFFEQGAAAFKNDQDKERTRLEKKIASLEEKVAKKNEVLGELMEAHIELKKSLGED